MNDIVLFLYNDSGQGMKPDTWKIGKVVSVSSRKVTVSFSGKQGKSAVASMRTLEWSMRDAGIPFSAGEFQITTNDPFQEVNSGR